MGKKEVIFPLKCFQCGRRRKKGQRLKKGLIWIKEFTDKNGYIRNLFKCPRCHQKCAFMKGTPRRFIVRERCLYCRQRTLSRRGYYYTKSKPRKHKRFFCSNCNRSVFFSQRRGIKRWDWLIYQAVKRLINERRIEINKYDGKKSPFYSSREITKIIYQTHHKKRVGKTTVSKLIKKFRVLPQELS